MQSKEEINGNIRKSRRKRERCFCLLYIMPIMYVVTYLLAIAGVTKDAADFAPPEGVYGVPFPLFGLLGMFAGIALSCLVFVIIVIIMCVKMYKQKKYEKQQMEILLSMGIEPVRITFQISWLWMLFPIILMTALCIVWGDFFAVMLIEVILINCMFWIWKVVQLIRGK